MIRTITALSATVLLASTALGAERSWTPGGFDSVELAGPYDVVVTSGGQPGVRADGPDDELDKMLVEVRNDTLVISRERQGVRDWFNWTSASKVRVIVNADGLRGAGVSGGGDMSVDMLSGTSASAGASGGGDLTVGRVEADTLEVGASGGGDIDLGTVRVDKAKIGASGGGDISLRGTCTSAEMGASGGGDIKAADFVCESVNVSASGGGDIRAHATQTARAVASGAGDVVLTGGADCEKRESGAGSVTCK